MAAAAEAAARAAERVEARAAVATMVVTAAGGQTEMVGWMVMVAARRVVGLVKDELVEVATGLVVVEEGQVEACSAAAVRVDLAAVLAARAAEMVGCCPGTCSRSG